MFIYLITLKTGKVYEGILTRIEPGGGIAFTEVNTREHVVVFHPDIARIEPKIVEVMP